MCIYTSITIHFSDEEKFLCHLQADHGLSSDGINVLRWQQLTSEARLAALTHTDVQQLRLDMADQNALGSAVFAVKQK